MARDSAPPPGVPSYGRRDAPGESEFSHGPGLTPKGLERAPVVDGGRYHGLSPRMKVPDELTAVSDLIAERSAGETGDA
ncbi:hypothetical protein [Rhodococcus sp. UNC23MFCrub1.1]|uniref:hypothetical protein n=1 Tax=Rhodococcus sp. UNC23MFCrub1.1 TaxID=1449068 RepID=UPI0012DD1434|nr:hypothetical protein [Rhodococcus sp. UNC23MFCrub1.1]